MKRIIHWLEVSTGIAAEVLENVLLSVAVILGLWLLSRLVLRLIFRQQKDLRKQYQWRKVTNYVTTALGFLLLVNIWFQGFQPIATFLGLLSAGLVLALKEPVLNMAGWLFIIWKRPFRVGDRIEISGRTGDVIDIRLFQFTLNEVQGWVEADQATGRVIHMPNGKLFTVEQANYNYGFPFVWHEAGVTITFESNRQKAKSILAAAVARHSEQLTDEAEAQLKRISERHLIFYQSLEPQIFTRVVENGVRLTMRYLCSIGRRRTSEHLIWEEVLDAFLATDDIRFAYPTTRFYQSEQAPLPPTAL
ncbi:mechanosensitive ion channel [Pontibacter sp. Tf4]|uniref:mechanosensitive ion channel family protein n=1 Tax=Pontibacter sp. Tf4 TaxID=2761620 RepID=UPI001628D784|nr:mechanosensitive ion channel domain-containing protein [Pontibacter sp. Tf4]MBB6611700.1 mechanosensitive ion channel [Pontibacter sp. Tf4]